MSGNWLKLKLVMIFLKIWLKISDQRFIFFYSHEAKVDEVCWDICKSNYIERDNPILPDDCIFMIFRIFCMLGEMVENDR